MQAAQHRPPYSLANTVDHLATKNRVTHVLNGDFIRSWSTMFPNWLSCIQNTKFLSTCGACLEVVLEFKWKSNLLACQNEFVPQWTDIGSSLCKPSHSLPAHHKITEHGRCCMQNYQLLTKSHLDLKHNLHIDVFGIFIKSLLYIVSAMIAAIEVHPEWGPIYLDGSSTLLSSFLVTNKCVSCSI